MDLVMLYVVMGAALAVTLHLLVKVVYGILAYLVGNKEDV